MKKRCVVRLSAEERDRREAAYRRRHAQVLLLGDEAEHGTGMIDREVAERAGCTRRTAEQIRKPGRGQSCSRAPGARHPAVDTRDLP